MRLWLKSVQCTPSKEFYLTKALEFIETSIFTRQIKE